MSKHGSLTLSHDKGNIIAAAVALLLCLAACAASRFVPLDPAAKADSEPVWIYIIIAGMWITPFAAIYCAKILLTGRRYRFLLSWLIGFLITDVFILCAILWPTVPPEGSYATKTEECVGMSILMALITGAITGFDSLLEFVLKWIEARRPLNGAVRFAVRVGIPALAITLMLFCA